MADDTTVTGTSSIFDSLSTGFDTLTQSFAGAFGSTAGAQAGFSIAGSGGKPTTTQTPKAGNAIPSSWKTLFNGTSGTGANPLVWIIGIVLVGVILWSFTGKKRKSA
jgi:hypothetical protein